MVLETLLSALGGGVLRLAPELLKVLDAKNERAHELAMVKATVDADKARAGAALAQEQERHAATFDAGAMQTLVEAIKAQAQPSGVKWIDGLSSTVRPTITFSFFGLYAIGRLATMVLCWKTGVPALDVLSHVWTGEDQMVLAGILNFWFVGRVFDRVTR